jgi:BMFP domain-containing protein YqiC
MQNDNRLLDDLAKAASGAFGALAGVRQDVEARVRAQFERILASMDLVTREEFEAVRAMAQAAREAQEVLAERLARLEAGPAEAPEDTPAPRKARARRGSDETDSGSAEG